MSACNAGERKLGGRAGRRPAAPLRLDLPGRLAECCRQPDHRHRHAECRSLAGRLCLFRLGDGWVSAGVGAGRSKFRRSGVALRPALGDRDGGAAVCGRLCTQCPGTRDLQLPGRADSARIRRWLGRRPVLDRDRPVVRESPPARVYSAISRSGGSPFWLGRCWAGAFADAGSWRAVFWTFAVQGAAVAGAAWFMLPDAEAVTSARVAWRQLGLIAVGVALISLADLADDFPLLPADCAGSWCSC